MPLYLVGDLCVLILNPVIALFGMVLVFFHFPTLSITLLCNSSKLANPN